MDTARLVLWLVFGIGMAVMLFLDLFVFHRKSHAIHFKEAMLWTIFWVGSAMAFAAAVFVFIGTKEGSEFLTAYLIEESLSVDNLFVFAVIFTYFDVPAQYQHRVLFWGIVGALVMRGAMIVAGVAVLDALHWMVFVFGAFLVFTSYKLATSKEAAVHPEKNLVVRLFKKVWPTTEGYEGNKFFVRRNGKLYATVLFVVLLVVETTDLIFALDSIPAVLAISKDPFIVYTSNGFAILGLRSIFFVLVGLLGYFHYLKVGLSAVLLFVGTKMIVSGFHIEIPVYISLAVVAGILLLAIIASVIRQKTRARRGLLSEERTG
ncbi:MAG: TerC family protein [SAR202 cluster bacterium]|nr:TerC family protein [SAR202 cluster bacterium]